MIKIILEIQTLTSILTDRKLRSIKYFFLNPWQFQIQAEIAVNQQKKNYFSKWKNHITDRMPYFRTMINSIGMISDLMKISRNWRDFHQIISKSICRSKSCHKRSFTLEIHTSTSASTDEISDSAEIFRNPWHGTRSKWSSLESVETRFLFASRSRLNAAC